MQAGGKFGAGALPPELIAAIEWALSRAREEVDTERKARLQTEVRAALDGWHRGRVTTAQAVLLLRITAQT